MNIIQHDLRAFEIEKCQATLPDLCELRESGDSYLLVGVNMTVERYKAIKAGLSDEIQAQLVGFRNIAR